MKHNLVAIVRYNSPLESVKQAIALSNGLEHMPPQSKVFLKPNIVYWTTKTNFPKWGCITTSRVIEDIVILLKEKGINDITIGEGIVLKGANDKNTPAHAFESLGYNTLKKRYGVQSINIFDRPFKKMDLGDGVTLNFNQDIINSDFVINLPAMKAHNQTVVSFGIKNLKGVIDRPSRKKCHNADPIKDLNYYIARLSDKMPPMLTLIDGIFSLEKGPGFDGRMRRSNLLIASADTLSADLVGAKVLGHEPSNVPHLLNACQNHGRPHDLSDIEIVGEKIESVASFHKYDFPYYVDDEVSLPEPMAKQGIRGIFYRKFDLSMCTYCSSLNGLVLTAIRHAWKGKPFDSVEVLTGKKARPTPGMKKTILFGQCMYNAHKNNPDINEMIPIKGCPPKHKEIIAALEQAGMDVDSKLFEYADFAGGLLLTRYHGKPEFDESFHKIL